MTSEQKNDLIRKSYNALPALIVGIIVAIISVTLTSSKQEKMLRNSEVKNKVSMEDFNREIAKLHREKANKEKVDMILDEMNSQSVKIDNIQEKQIETYQLLVEIANK